MRKRTNCIVRPFFRRVVDPSLGHIHEQSLIVHQFSLTIFTIGARSIIFLNYRIRDLHTELHGQSHRLSPSKSICHHLYLRYCALRSLLFNRFFHSIDNRLYLLFVFTVCNHKVLCNWCKACYDLVLPLLTCLHKHLKQLVIPLLVCSILFSFSLFQIMIINFYCFWKIVTSFSNKIPMYASINKDRIIDILRCDFSCNIDTWIIFFPSSIASATKRHFRKKTIWSPPIVCSRMASNASSFTPHRFEIK